MRSMHHYHLKNLTHPHWNMGHIQSTSFINTYEKYFAKSNQNGFRAVYLDFFAGKSYRQNLIKDLGIEIFQSKITNVIKDIFWF